MAGLANVEGDPGTWRTARDLGKELVFPTGPYEPRVPTAAEMNAVLPYIIDRMARFAADKYFCENAEITMAHVLGINVPRHGFPDSTGYNPKTGRNWEGYNQAGYDQAGYNKDGYNSRGLDRDGLDRQGYDYNGYDKDGYNRKGVNANGLTRDEALTNLVTGWSPAFAAAIAAHVADLAEPKPVKKVAKKAAPAKKAAAKAPAKKAAPKAAAEKVAAPPRLNFAKILNDWTEQGRHPLDPANMVAPRRRDHHIRVD